MKNFPTCLIIATFLLLILLPGKAPSEGVGPATEADEKVLASVGLKADGASLAGYFQQRTPTENTGREIEQLIRGLGHEEFPRREAASQALARWGPPALPALRKALKDADPEIARRARECIDHIETGLGPLVPGAAGRALAALRQPGAVHVLLQFLPFADSESVFDELCASLLALSRPGDKVDVHFLAALDDPLPARRAGAAHVVGRRGSEAELGQVRRLLVDREPAVRFRTACALLVRQDRAAVPALVELLADGPTELAWQAEDMLITLAGESTPAVLGTVQGGEERRKNRDVWNDWFHRQGKDIALARYEENQRLLGLTLGIEYNTNRVFEVGRDGSLRWEIANLGGPMEAQVLPGGRILIADSQSQTISERSTQGLVLWQLKVAGEPTGVQRLANGNTFVSTYSSVMEYDREGRQLFNLKLPAGSNAIRKHRNGNVIFTLETEIVEMSPAGQKVRSVTLPRDGMWVGLRELPGDRFLVSNSTSGRILEVDRSGHILWQAKVNGACGVNRTPNGHTLVAANNRIVELNRVGQVVWETTTPGYVRRVHRR